MRYHIRFFWLIFENYPELTYQCISVPFALLFYFLTRGQYLSLTCRYTYLAVGGAVLAFNATGSYSWLLFLPALASAGLAVSLGPHRIHPCMLCTQMGWLTFWHISLQYNEDPHPRQLIAISALMLLIQRSTTLSMDIQEGKLVANVGLFSRTPPVLPFISYMLYFPALLGGPLCCYRQFVQFVEQSSSNPPPPPLCVVLFKIFLVLLLEWIKLQIDFLCVDLDCVGIPGRILLVCILSMNFRLRYYSHWTMSECLNNAAGLGFRGYTKHGRALWDGLSEGNLWRTEFSVRPSEFARRWNSSTAKWLRRLVFLKCPMAPLYLTFSFCAWWHGMQVGQVAGFLGWAAAVKADYKVYAYLQPKLTRPWKKHIYKLFSWIQTQIIITCVVIAVEIGGRSAFWLLCKTYIIAFPMIYIILSNILNIN